MSKLLLWPDDYQCLCFHPVVMDEEKASGRQWFRVRCPACTAKAKWYKTPRGARAGWLKRREKRWEELYAT